MSKGYVKTLNLSESKPDSRDESIFNNLAGGDAANDIRLFDGNLRNTSTLSSSSYSVSSGLITVNEDGKVAFSNNVQVYETGTPNTLYTVYESNGVNKFRLKDSNDNPYSPTLDLVRSDAITNENLLNINNRRLETFDARAENLISIGTGGLNSDIFNEYTIKENYDIIDNFSSLLGYRKSLSLLNYQDNNFNDNLNVSGYVRITNDNDVPRDDTSPGIFILNPLASVSTFLITQDGAPSGITWNDDGTKMYVTGGVADILYEYDLSTPYDVNTAVYNNVFLDTGIIPATGGYLFLAGAEFNDTGSKLFIVDEGNQGIHTYNLSTPYDLNTASYANNESFSISSQDIYPDGVRFNSDGSRMFVVGAFDAAVFQYNLGTNFDVSTAVYSGVKFDLNNVLGGGPYSTYGLCFNPTGTVMLITDASGAELIRSIRLSTGFDLSTALYFGEFIRANDFNPDATAIQDAIFNDDGTKLYLIGSASDDVTQINLTTPYDIVSAYDTDTGVAVRAFEGTSNPWAETGTSLETTSTESIVNKITLTNPNITGISTSSATGDITSFTHMLKTTINGEDYYLLLN